METLSKKRNLAAISRETPEKTRNSQSQNTLDLEMAQEYFWQVSEEIEGRVTIQHSKELSLTESSISVALSKIDEPTLLDLFRSCSGNIQEQRLGKPENHQRSFLRR